LKNKQALILLFLSNGITGFAQGITMLSIPWYFAQTGNSSFFTISYAGITVASLFWGLYAGAIIDGFNRKDVFLGTNFIAGLVVLCIASLGFKEQILPDGLIVMVFTVTFFGYYMHYPNLYAFAQEITEPKYYTRITTYIEIIGQATAIFAAGISVILLQGVNYSAEWPLVGQVSLYIEKWYIYEIFLLDGFAYLLSFLVIILIKYKAIKVVFDYDEAPLIERLRTGYDYLVEHPLISLFGACSFAILIVVLVQIFALLPIYVTNHLNSTGDVLATTEFMYGLGSLISGFLIGQILKRMSIPISIILLTFLTAFAFLLAAFTQSVALYYVFALIIGFTNSGSRIFRVSYLFGLIPNAIMGRVNSMFNVYSTIFRFIFLIAFAMDFFNEGSNITYAYMILGGYALISGFVLIFINKKVLKLTEPKSTEIVTVEN
jgi:DHA3 family macrolide efflux protein-like MFS transporter